MKLQFDPSQQFQLDAVAAITGLFDGQPQGAPEEDTMMTLQTYHF
jgi:type III restriction enzyme